MPVYRRVDTCASEFATSTCYMCSTYADQCESSQQTIKILVLGSGPNRIGQEFESYCCVHASLAMQEEDYDQLWLIAIRLSLQITMFQIDCILGK